MLKLRLNAEHLIEVCGQIIFDSDSDLAVFGMLPEKGRRGIDDLVNPDDLIIIL